MKYVIGDLTKIKEGIVAHQTNLDGVMGAGVAFYLAKVHAGLLDSYRDHCQKNNPQLGTVYKWSDNHKLVIANVFSQRRGVTKDEVSRNHGITSYDSIITAFEHLENCFPSDLIYVPFCYGCGIAGGDWTIVEAIFQKFENVVVVCREADVLNYLGNTARVKKWISSLEVLHG